MSGSRASIHWELPWSTLPTVTSQSVYSSPFGEDHLGTKWCLQLYPMGDITSPGEIALYLWKKSYGEVRLARWQFTLIDGQRRELQVSSGREVMLPEETHRVSIWNASHALVLGRSHIVIDPEAFLPRGMLSLLCEVWISETTAPKRPYAHFELEWPLPRFYSISSNTLYSPVVCEEVSNSDWALMLQPRLLYHSKNKEYLSVNIEKQSQGNARAKVFMAIMDNKRNLRYCKKFSYDFKDLSCCGYDRFLSRDTLFQQSTTLLPKEQLTLYCEVEIVEFTSPPDPWIKYTVENFPTLPHAPGKFLEVKPEGRHDWFLRIYPRGLYADSDGEDEQYVALEVIYKHKTGRVYGDAKCEVRNEEVEYEEEATCHVMRAVPNPDRGSSFIWPRFVHRDQLTTLTNLEGSLTLAARLKNAHFDQAYDWPSSLVRFQRNYSIKMKSVPLELEEHFTDPYDDCEWILRVIKSEEADLEWCVSCNKDGVKALCSLAILLPDGNKWLVHHAKVLTNPKVKEKQGLLQLVQCSALDTHASTLMLDQPDAKLYLKVEIEIFEFSSMPFV